PIGLIWDSTNYSCGYDAFFTVLYNIWIRAPGEWSAHLRSTSNLMTQLSALLAEVSQELLTFENARDNVRRMMHAVNPQQFPYGVLGTSIDKLVGALFHVNRTHARGQRKCNTC
ncbi:hypothetical protein B0H16DRAFT_1219719, partial [Mycena metata]